MEDDVKVLYVAGTGRSGSTLLANILGEIEGYFTGGEIRYLWERGIIENRLCGCGQPFNRCPLWRGILDDASIEGDHAESRRILERQQHTTRVRQLPLMLAWRDGGGPLDRRAGDYPVTLSRLYRAIQAMTGARIIVDSSKLPAYGHMLDRAPGVELFVVHLVRDPRAAAYSWLRKKKLEDSAGRYMQRLGPWHSATLWLTWNFATECLWGSRRERYIFLRYEDFVAAPESAVRRILRMLGDEGAALPFTESGAARLGVNHTVAGNPDRLRHGVIDLRGDEDWRHEMQNTDLLQVTAITAPLLRRYNYPIAVRRT